MRQLTKLNVLILIVMIVLISQSAFAGMEPGTFKLEGKGYFYYSHEMGAIGNEFDLARMYIGTKYQISEKFMARWISDIAHEDKKEFELFAKYAYLDWDIGWQGGHLLMGLQGTNNWSAPEKAWGYRSIRYSPMESFGKFWSNGDYVDRLDDWADTLLANNTTADSAKAALIQYQSSNFTTSSATETGSSADLGVGLKLKPSDMSYVNVMIRNGGGYKKKETDMYKNFQVRGGCYLMEKALHISAYVEMEPWKGIDDAGEPKSYTNFQWDVMAHYQQKGLFSIGVDVNSKTFKGNFEDITALCISGFGNVDIIKGELKLLARYDIYNTGFNDAELATGEATPETNGSLLIAGLDWMPSKKVHIIPNIQITDYESSGKDADGIFFIHLEFKL